jgi:hypothetical protein
MALILVFDLLDKNFNLGYIFWMLCTRILIFTWVFFMSSPFYGYKTFLPCDLDLGAWPTYWNFNLDRIFWIVGTRALIFHTRVPSDKSFLWVPTDLNLWPWPVFDLPIKTLTMALSYGWYVLRLWSFTWVFHMTRPFRGYQQIWSWPWCLTYILKTLTMLKVLIRYVLGLDISHKCSSWQDLSMFFNKVYLVTLTLVFDLITENFNLSFIVWMVCTRILIFHMRVPCNKNFLWVPTDLTL